MGYGEEVNTSDFDSDIRGFDSHYPCSFVYVFAFAGLIPASPVIYSCIRRFDSY